MKQTKVYFKYLLFLLFIISCGKENGIEEYDIQQDEISNPVALFLKQIEDTKVPSYNSLIKSRATNSTFKADNDQAQWNSFTDEYGEVVYDQTGILDSTITSTLFPLIDNQSILKSWLVGFYNQDGEIEFRVRKINKEKEPEIQFNEKGKIVYSFGEFVTHERQRASSKHSTNDSDLLTNYVSTSCTETYRVVCSYTDMNQNGVHDPDFDSELVCKHYLVSTDCDISIEVQFDPGDDAGDAWINPFGDASGGAVNNDEEDGNEVCPDGYVKDLYGNCIKKPCIGDPVKYPEIAKQTISGIKGGMHDTCARINKAYTCKGIKERKLHNGIDLKNPKGAPIFAIYDGMATTHEQRNKETGELDGAGYYTAIVSEVNGKTVRMVYFHLEKDNRVTGMVMAGDIIGYQGDSGNLKNAIEQELAVSHLHIKTQEDGVSADPLNHIKTQIDPATGELINNCL